MGSAVCPAQDEDLDGQHRRAARPAPIFVAARYTLPGIIAHESARRGGVRLDIPDFGDAPA
ncbi:hypothetical protein [Actinacidiphila soli]|uniref:hypothetical protein n=1 Tax=Actinacidiphila soli TaxID=2487275 RepID=UPI000FCBABF4|nr:hypothetical protein [Actinacidiphila soli]